MKKDDAIKILLTLWHIIKVVSLFTYKYGSIILKFVWKAFVSILPTLVYFIMCFLGGVAGGAADAASQKASTPGRPWPYRRTEEENSSYYYTKR